MPSPHEAQSYGSEVCQPYYTLLRFSWSKTVLTNAALWVITCPSHAARHDGHLQIHSH
jgi:hypothetical protein